MDAVNIWKRNQEFLTWDPFWPDIIFWFYYKLLFPIAAQEEAFKHYEVIAPSVRYIFLAFRDTSPHIGNMILWDQTLAVCGVSWCGDSLHSGPQWQCCSAVGRCGRRGLINQLTPLSTILQQLPATLTSQTTGLELDTQTFCVETFYFTIPKWVQQKFPTRNEKVNMNFYPNIACQKHRGM